MIHYLSFESTNKNNHIRFVPEVMRVLNERGNSNTLPSTQANIRNNKMLRISTFGGLTFNSQACFIYIHICTRTNKCLSAFYCCRMFSSHNFLFLFEIISLMRVYAVGHDLYLWQSLTVATVGDDDDDGKEIKIEREREKSIMKLQN